MNILKFLQVCEVEADGPIIEDEELDFFDYGENYTDLHWKGMIFGMAIVLIIACLAIPWMVGVMQIFKWVF